MREYHGVFGHELPPLPREPVPSLFLIHSFRPDSYLGGCSPPPPDVGAPPPPSNNASTSTQMAIPIAVSMEAIVILAL